MCMQLHYFFGANADISQHTINDAYISGDVPLPPTLRFKQSSHNLRQLLLLKLLKTTNNIAMISDFGSATKLHY